MTSYSGGKQRIGQQIADIIVDTSLDIADDTGFCIKGYCEPFCGMLGVYRHVPALLEERGLENLDYRAGDINESVVKMWQAAQKGWVPPITCSEKRYNQLKNSKGSSAEKGFIGHQFSFGGQCFGVFKKITRFETVSKRVCEIAEELFDVKFSSGKYTQYTNLNGYVIYCDPPYANTDYRYKEETRDGLRRIKFDNANFWDWCRKMSKKNIVFISEYTAPKDFKKIRIKNYIRNTNIGSNCTGNEYVFIHESYVN